MNSTYIIQKGAITSVTNFASSLSRNMDKLSLDAEHTVRQEAGRKHKPDRLVTGLRHGLVGFGVSLLGKQMHQSPLPSLPPN